MNNSKTNIVRSRGGTRPSIKELLSDQYWKKMKGDAKRPWADNAEQLGLATIASVFTGSGIFFVPYIAGIGQKLGKKIGIKCKKKVDRTVPYDYPLAVLSIAAFLSEEKLRILGVEDTDYGSIIEAELPADWKSFSGTLFFEVFDHGISRTTIAGTSIVKGQLIDYGKGKRALKEIIEGAERFLHRISMDQDNT